jgi:nitrogen fixation protein FixH
MSKSMKSLQSLLICLSSVGLIFLVSCSNGNQAGNTETASQSSSEAKTSSSIQAEFPPKGGQVVESGKYHLQFVPEKEDKGTHLDFYLLKDDNHQPIPDAKVTAQIQMPNGNQKTLNLTYDPAGKHYTALLPENATGQYQVRIISDVNGDKVNGRFNFNK